MFVEQELSGLTPARPSLLSIGVFDGVHLGHQTLLRRLVSEAKKQELISGVITFRQHPLKLLSPQGAPPYIASPAENIRLIKALGVDLVITLAFDAELAQIDSQTFVLLLQHHLKMQGLILGWDFAMGRHREGTLQTLEALSQKLGFSIEVVPAVMLAGEVVSSSAIRNAILAGDMGKANAMLGRPFSMEGRVVTGAGRGAELGFPTANLDTNPSQVLPAEGVYATIAYLEGRPYPSVANIGRCLTFGQEEGTVEAHLLDFEGDIYCKTIRLDIIEFLRHTRRFESAEALKEQVARDIAQARERFKGRTNECG